MLLVRNYTIVRPVLSMVFARRSGREGKFSLFCTGGTGDKTGAAGGIDGDGGRFGSEFSRIKHRNIKRVCGWQQQPQTLSLLGVCLFSRAVSMQIQADDFIIQVIHLLTAVADSIGIGNLIPLTETVDQS